MLPEVLIRALLLLFFLHEINSIARIKRHAVIETGKWAYNKTKFFFWKHGTVITPSTDAGFLSH